MNKLRFSYSSLALLDWLCEKGPGRRLMSRQGGSGGSVNYRLYEVRNPAKGGDKPRIVSVLPSMSRLGDGKQQEHALLDRLGGSAAIDTLKMVRAGFFRSYHPLGHTDPHGDGKAQFKKMISQYAHDPFHWGDTISFPSEKAFEYWNAEGREEYGRQRAERERAKEQARRMVLIGHQVRVNGHLPEEIRRQIPDGVHLPLPHFEVQAPAYTAVVVRESANRVYLTDVQGLPEFGDRGWRDRPVHGNPPNQYISPDQILLDHATPADVERLQRINEEFQEDVDRITAELVARVLPGLTELYSRLAQKKAERDDMLREFMESRTAGKSDVEAPDFPKP